MRAVTREEIQEIDRRATQEFGVPTATLMENAGKAVVDVVLQEFNPLEVTVLCGRGNNGGDGFVVARHLAEAGVVVHVYAAAVASEYRGAALENYGRISVEPLVPEKIEWGEVAVDALLGTGLTRPVEGVLREVIERMNENPPIVAVDIPSGLEANEGKVLGVAVRANITVTMGMPKVGLLVLGARPYVGRIIVADIGYPPELAR